MSLIESFSPARGSDPGAAEFVAFLADAKSVETMERFALERMIPHTHIRQGTMADAVEFLGKLERPPRQLVVDISVSAMPLSDLNMLADACAPSISVVVVGERNDVGFFRELLRMGVDDYISKPLTLDLLHRLLGTSGGVAEPVHHVRTGKLVACLGARGGVGTTTVAVNLAWHLAHEVDRRVVFLDLDPFGGPANILLGTESNNGLGDVLKNVKRLDPQYIDRTLITAAPKLMMLSAQLNLDSGERLDPVALRDLIGELKKHFHYLVVDLPDRAGALSMTVMDEAQVIALVTEPSVYAARETVRLMRVAETRDTHSPLMLVVNQTRPAGKMELTLADFEDSIGRKASHVLPYDRDAAGKAENLGPPLAAAKGALSDAMRRVGDDLAGRSPDKATAKRSGLLDHPLIRRLLGRDG